MSLPEQPRLQLDLQRLHQYCRLSSALLDCYAEAADVMLWKFHEAPPTSARLEVRDETRTIEVLWKAPDAQARASHANEKDATEYAAYAVAFAAVHVAAGYTVQRRIHQGAGADFLMTRRGEPDNDFIKLEVSGVARGDGLNTRLEEKLKQVRGGDLERPGVAVVVGLEAARILVGETD
ncbi:hypothetical protein [Archangium sp.]|uniref:hypothetical protein n=1 Tax=Archangium sp. TaxID=1872627 RepID=UPI00286ABC41|nr:hypothetical protein [Archangium sp.]